MGPLLADVGASEASLVLVFVVLLAPINVYVAIRWWLVQRVRRYPAVKGQIIGSQRRSYTNSAGSRVVLTFAFTPTAGPLVGQEVLVEAPARTLARYEATVGQSVTVHYDPADPTRFFAPVSGNPWVPQLVFTLLADLALLVFYLSGALGA